jgi:hypothetical protein
MLIGSDTGGGSVLITSLGCNLAKSGAPLEAFE